MEDVDYIMPTCVTQCLHVDYINECHVDYHALYTLYTISHSFSCLMQYIQQFNVESLIIFRTAIRNASTIGWTVLMDGFTLENSRVFVRCFEMH